MSFAIITRSVAVSAQQEWVSTVPLPFRRW